jgi:N-methylhydantoinase B/oxoprolinase/acetone carboxylase alpha subunit
VLNPGGPEARELPGKVWGYPLRAGERVAIETPGGGGYGPPHPTLSPEGRG